MWGIGRMSEGSAATMLKAMIICTMIQSARAHEPLALDTSSIELYAVIVVVAVAVIGIWEFTWLCVDRCCVRQDTRSTRRLRRLREAVQRELDVQLHEREDVIPPEPLTSPTAAPTQGGRRSTRSSAASASAPTVPLGSYRDEMTQTTIDENYIPIIEYIDRDVLVPVREWHPGPVFVSPHGDTFHTVEGCWGLRNTKARGLRMCQCCRENQGRSLRVR